MMPVMPLTRHELIAQIQVIPATGCWKFLGSIDGNGYGRIFDHGKESKAHRVFYETWIEPIEGGISSTITFPQPGALGMPAATRCTG
jgi:hypothetical protein